jgi:hypothetical protein
MISVDYRLAGRALMKPLRSGIRSVLRVLEWLLRASPQPSAAPQETTQVAALPAETPPALAVTEDLLAGAVGHLEYLGYEVELQPDGWSYAKHPNRYNFHLRTFPHGINLFCMVGIGASIDNSRAGWLEYLNMANDRGQLIRFALVADKDDLCHVRMRARVTGAYNRSVFAMVMDLWHDDLDLIRRRPEFPLERLAETHKEAAAVTVN